MSDHLSGFGVCCPGCRRDLKPDYRMSGFGSNDLIKAGLYYIIFEIQSLISRFIESVYLKPQFTAEEKRLTVY